MNDPDNPLEQYENFQDQREYDLALVLVGEDRDSIRRAKQELAEKYQWTREGMAQFVQAVNAYRRG